MKRFGFLPDLPKKAHNSESVSTFFFYDTARSIGTRHLEWLEKLFSSANEQPANLILHSNAHNGEGRWLRLKDGFGAALMEAEKGGPIDFRISSKRNDTNMGFCPSDLTVSMNTSGPGCLQGVISMNDDRGTAYVLELAKDTYSMSGQFYGHASDFPAILGPEAYSAGMGTIPRGWNFMSTRAYTKRLTAWRKNTSKLTALNGKFREVFPVNFLKREHLDQKIGTTDAIKIYELLGTLTNLKDTEDQFVWELPRENMAQARVVLEEAGLILSMD